MSHRCSLCHGLATHLLSTSLRLAQWVRQYFCLRCLNATLQYRRERLLKARLRINEVGLHADTDWD